MQKRRSRTDESGAAYRGSRRQIQLYVNEFKDELNSAIAVTIPDFPPKAGIVWKSPLCSEKFREYWDKAWLRVLGLPGSAKQLGDFWPKGGPHWDALARYGEAGTILVEAKAHPTEIFNEAGCRASSPQSRAMIEKALQQTCEWLKVQYTEKWLGRAYQSANRLAHLFFLREIAKVDAWLVNIYFIDDRSHKPTSRDEWTNGIASLKAELGIAGTQIPHSGDLFLQAVSEIHSDE